jgi:DNA-binding transcriptional LysR family regulator
LLQAIALLYRIMNTAWIRGEQYLKEVSGILHGLAVGTERSISDVNLDCLRLHSSPSFGLLWLMPRLKQCRQSHPYI